MRAYPGTLFRVSQGGGPSACNDLAFRVRFEIHSGCRQHSFPCGCGVFSPTVGCDRSGLLKAVLRHRHVAVSIGSSQHGSWLPQTSRAISLQSAKEESYTA